MKELWSLQQPAERSAGEAEPPVPLAIEHGDPKGNGEVVMIEDEQPHLATPLEEPAKVECPKEAKTWSDPNAAPESRKHRAELIWQDGSHGC